jgi:hypothetical protein
VKSAQAASTVIWRPVVYICIVVWLLSLNWPDSSESNVVLENSFGVDFHRISSAIQERKHLVDVNWNNVEICRQQVKMALNAWDAGYVPLHSRVLVIYHVGCIGEHDSFSLNEINIKLFLSSLVENKLRDSTLVVINVVNGKGNPLKRAVETYAGQIKNSFVLDWHSASSDILAHAITIGLLQREAHRVSTVFALNQGVRGPFVRRSTWMLEFIDMLKDGVKLVGPVLSCEKEPHVQTHMFGFSTDILELFLRHELEMRSNMSWGDVILHCEVGLSGAVQNAGYRISAVLNRNKWGEQYFNGSCQDELGTSNPTGWCGMEVHDAIFLKWGGEFYRQRLYCNDTLKRVSDATKAFGFLNL